MALRTLGVCDGYSGFELGLRLALGDDQVRTVCRVERDSHAAATLVARMEEQNLDRAPIWDDLATFDGRAWRDRVDLVTAGFPCQPWSVAGRRGGVDDDRWLWPQIFRIIREVGPRLVFLENTPGLNGKGPGGGGLPYILQDLADLGFDAEWGLLAASEIGAPHVRRRLWLLAAVGDTSSDGFEAVGHRPESERARLRGDADRPGARAPVADTEAARPESASSGDRRAGFAGSGGRDPEDVADPSSLGGAPPNRPEEGREDGRGVVDASRTWPPSQDDHAGWVDYVAAGGPEPAVRRGPDGRSAGLADAIALGGNGLVPRVAAEAFTELAVRLGIARREPRLMTDITSKEQP